MALDPQGAVITKLFNVLTGDATLQGLFGGSVNLHPGNAGKDPEYPYMVHQLSGTDKDILRGDGFYYLDIYSNAQTLTEIWKINRRVKILLTERRFSTSDVQFRTGDTDTFEQIPSPTEGVQHYSGRWPLPYYKTELTNEITSR